MISQKPPKLETRGGIFLFGYRIVDDLGNFFKDDTVLSTNIKTEENVWNEAE